MMDNGCRAVTPCPAEELPIANGYWKIARAAPPAFQVEPPARTFAGIALATMVADRLAGATAVALVAALTANIREISIMSIRTDRLHRQLMMIVAVLFGCLLMSFPSAAQGTPEQRAACEADAIRLCGDYVPDERRITACMSGKRRYLSPGCRRVFDSAKGRRR